MACRLHGSVTINKPRYNYILLFVDRFSKWIKAIPLPDMSAASTTKALVENIICRHGILQSIHTDRGTQFESDFFNSVCKNFGIKHSHSTPYHLEGMDLPNAMLKALRRKLVLDVTRDRLNGTKFSLWLC